MRLALLVSVGAALLAAGSAAAKPKPADHLRIIVWPQGTSAAPRAVRTLACRPAGGTLAAPKTACAKLAALDTPFAAVPDGIMCSQIFSGPQVAVVTGSFQGRRVWARFRRTDSCQTERWDRVAFLFRAG